MRLIVRIVKQVISYNNLVQGVTILAQIMTKVYKGSHFLILGGGALIVNFWRHLR